MENALQGRNRFFLGNPWLQLIAGIAGMIAITNLQYSWTLFVLPLHAKYGWDVAGINVAFTLFVLAETWLVPVEGYFVDKLGPALMVALGGVMVGGAWVLNAAADSLALLYLAQVMGGAGAGVVYGASIGNALKWFPQRRGLAAGLTAAAFGAGSALTVPPISAMIRDDGYEAAFFWFGLAQGAVILLTALILRPPPAGPKTAPRAQPNATALADRDFTWPQVLRTPLFWFMYLTFVLVTTGGLVLTAHVASMAKDFQVADTPVSLFGITMAALPFALMLDRLLNGLTRPLFGWISDHLGRENTMFLAFGLEGLAILLFITQAHDPVLFVLLTGLTFFAWGEAYSIFPALCADVFGRKYATTNYGLLYTAKGTAALLVPLGNLLHQATGGWLAIFVIAVVFDWLAALLALFVLKPLRKKWCREVSS